MGSQNWGNVRCFFSKVLKTREMLNMSNVFGGPFQEMLKTGEMLNMLNMLNVLGQIGHKRPKHLT